MQTAERNPATSRIAPRGAARLILIAAMTLVFAACGDDAASSGVDLTAAESNATTSSTAELTTATAAPTTTSAPATTSAPKTTSTAAATSAPTSTTASPTTTESTTTESAPTTVAPTTTDSPATTNSPTTTAARSTTTPAPAATAGAGSSVTANDPTSAAELASELTEAELAIRNPAVSDTRAATWGERQQRLYRVLSANPEWGDEVLAGVDDSVRFAVGKNWAARKESSALVNSRPLSPTLPAWRINEPRPTGELLSYYQAASAKTDVPWEVLAAINLVETRMGRIEGLSTAGAVGPMQFLPSTWNECCEGDPTDPEDAIHGAAYYLTVRGAPGNLGKAIRGYNNSAHYVNAVQGYAAVMDEDPLAYRGYHAWQVYFASSAGLIRMPVGYEQSAPIAAADWIASNPDALAG